MALAGTLKDFSLADIFQLIGLQKKTGILTLSNGKEEARILFLNGLVVGADTNQQKLENHLGHVLVKSNRITKDELDQVLEIQSQTLQRLGQVLIQKAFIKPEDLRDSLQIQTTQIIYRLFRWTDGEYHFQQEKFVDYDQENFSPISSDAILMEGVRMLDEWPMIEQLIPNFEVLLERTEKASNLKLDDNHDFSLDGSAGESFDTLLEDVLSDDMSGSRGRGDETGGELSRSQEMVLKLVDGVSVVQEIIDRSGMNEFETCRTLYDLIQMGYVRRVAARQEQSVKVIEEEHHIPIWIPASLLGLIALFSSLVSWNPLNKFFPLPSELAAGPAHYKATTLHRMRIIADAIELHYAKEGSLPLSLDSLAVRDRIDRRVLTDPLGRILQYQPDLNDNSYRLSGLDRSGAVSEELVIEDAFPAPAELGQTDQ